MPTPLDELREQIEALCRRYHVCRLDLFGSAATGGFDPARSDVDLLVEFEALGDAAYADAWFGLHESLEALVGRPVDLVSAGGVRNPYFRDELRRTRRTLYAA